MVQLSLSPKNELLLTLVFFNSIKIKGPGETITVINKAIYDDLRTLKSFVILFCAD